MSGTLFRCQGYRDGKQCETRTTGAWMGWLCPEHAATAPKAALTYKRFAKMIQVKADAAIAAQHERMMRFLAEPAVYMLPLLPRQPHAFVRGHDGPDRLGPPDETCAICQCDPRNSIHHTAECKRTHAGKACGCAINAPATPADILKIPYKTQSTPTDPLDVEYDGVTLRVLLIHDERARRDRHGDHPNLATPAQRAAISAHWSAELRARVKASAERERNRVLVDCEEL